MFQVYLFQLYWWITLKAVKTKEIKGQENPCLRFPCGAVKFNSKLWKIFNRVSPWDHWD